MYTALTKKEKNSLKNKICIDMFLPQYELSYYSRTESVISALNLQNGSLYPLFKMDVDVDNNVIAFSNFDYNKTVKSSKNKGTLELFCGMVVDKMITFAKKMDYSLIMISGTLPFLPEIFLNLHFEITQHKFTKQQTWCGTKDL